MNEDEKWYRDCRNFKPKQPDAGFWELQNKFKFIKFGSQEAEIALRVGKIIIMCIMEKSRFKVNFGGSIHERILN